MCDASARLRPPAQVVFVKTGQDIGVFSLPHGLLVRFFPELPLLWEHSPGRHKVGGSRPLTLREGSRHQRAVGGCAPRDAKVTHGLQTVRGVGAPSPTLFRGQI